MKSKKKEKVIPLKFKNKWKFKEGMKFHIGLKWYQRSDYKKVSSNNQNWEIMTWNIK